METGWGKNLDSSADMVGQGWPGRQTVPGSTLRMIKQVRRASTGLADRTGCHFFLP